MQVSPSRLHDVPSGLDVLPGHVPDVPEQTALFSHGPLAALQMVPAATNLSAGQVLLVPLQTS